MGIIAYAILEYRTARLGNVISLVVLHRLLAKAFSRHGSSSWVVKWLAESLTR